MGLLDDGGTDFEQVRGQVIHVTQEIEQDYLLYRYQRGVIDHMQDPSMRGLLTEPLVSDHPEWSRGQQLIMDHHARPTAATSQAVEVVRGVQRRELAQMESRLSSRFSHHPEAIVAYAAWRDGLHVVLGLNMEVRAGIPIDVMGLSGNAMDDFTRNWNVLDAQTKRDLTPFLQESVRIERGDVPLPTPSARHQPTRAHH